MTAILPPRLDAAAQSDSLPRPEDSDRIISAAVPDERWFEQALNAVQEIARRLVPGCDHAAVDLIEAHSAPPAAEREHSRPLGQAPGPMACDRLSLALLSGPMNEGGELLGVLHLFSHRQAFGPGAAEPAALVARLTASLVAGRRQDRSD